MRRKIAVPENVPVLGKKFPTAPLEKAPPEGVRALLDGNKIDEVVARGDAAIPALLKIMQGKNKGAAKKASLALVKMGEPGADALVKSILGNKTIMQLKREEWEGFYLLVDEAAEMLALPGQAAVPFLIKLVKGDLYSNIEDCKRQALEKIGSAAVSELVKAVSGNKDEATASLLQVLTKIGDASAIPAFVKALRETREGELEGMILDNTMFHVVSGIGEFAEKNPDYAWGEAVPLLTNELGAHYELDDACYHHNVIHALGRVGDPSPVPRLMELFGKNRDAWKGAGFIEYLRETAERKLGRKTERRGETDEDETCEAIAEAIERIAKKNPGYAWGPFIQNIAESITGRLLYVRIGMSAALLHMARGRVSDCKPAIPNLVRALMDENVEVVKNAARALRNIAMRNPDEVAAELTKAVNGGLGERLREVNSING